MAAYVVAAYFVVGVAENTAAASVGVDEHTVVARMLELGDTVRVLALARVPCELTWL